MSNPTVLIAEDEDQLRIVISKVMREEGFNVIGCRDGREALQELSLRPVDAIITDLRMPGVDGLELIDRAKSAGADAPIIVITAFGEVDTAVEAMRKGAQDYMCKPVNLDELIIKIRKLIADRDLAQENRILREQISMFHQGTGMVAESPEMKRILKLVERIAPSMSNVLLLGESGTGKEVLARTIHEAGPTRERAFVAANCGGLSENLIESELFGHRRGSFTGADSDRIGYFESASGGTLFLDEICSLPIGSQSVLLRAIDEKAVIRVGETHPRKVSLRIIAAANSDLKTAVDEGTFREDLYYRLNIVSFELPALRDRVSEIPAFVEHFVYKYNDELNSQCPGFTDAALDALCAHSWPGNIRELANVVERAVLFARDRAVDVRDLPAEFQGADESPVMPSDLKAAAKRYERQHIINVLARYGENRTHAANALGIGVSSLYRKLEEFGIGKRYSSKQPPASLDSETLDD